MTRQRKKPSAVSRVRVARMIKSHRAQIRMLKGLMAFAEATDKRLGMHDKMLALLAAAVDARNR